MSYNAETANKPLTGETFDRLILSEREQRHIIGDGDLRGYHIMPAAEYCELRDMYVKLLEERNGGAAYGDGPEDMTVEQAIAILDPKTSRAVLYEYEYFGGFKGGEARLAACDKACEIAAEVMRQSISQKRRLCGEAERNRDGTCRGYQRAENDDEPAEMCRRCAECESNRERQEEK